MLLWAVVNVVVSVFVWRVVRSPLIRAYLLVNYILIVNPAFLTAFLDAAHPLHVHGDEGYTTALVYMAAFNMVLCGAFLVFLRVLPPSRLAIRHVINHRLNFSSDIIRLSAIACALAAVGLAGKLLLNAMGAFRMNDVGAEGPLLQAVKVFGGFDIVAIIVLGEWRLSVKRRARLLDATIAGLLATSLFVAFLSGSRSQTVTVVLLGLLAYRDLVRRYWGLVVPGLLVLLPSIFLLFPLLGTYRGHDYDIDSAVYQLDSSGADKGDVMLDVLTTRLNYLEPLGRVVNLVEVNGPAGGAVYWNNLVGLIPRAIWPGKPQISNDSQELGHILGLVTLDDSSTSVGLQVVGESFYEYGWLGLWVAVFQALIFCFFHKNFFVPGNTVAMSIYTYSALYLLQRDGYFAVIPGLAWLIIGFYIFFGAFSVFLPARQPRRSNEALSDSFPR